MAEDPEHSAPEPLRFWPVFGLFALIVGAFLLVAGSTRDPAPIYPTLQSGNPEQYFACDLEQPVTFQFIAPGNLDGVYFRVFLPNQRVEMTARSLSQGDELGTSKAGLGWKEPDQGEGGFGPRLGPNFGLDASLDFNRRVLAGEEIQVVFTCVKFWGEVNKGGVKLIREDWEPSLDLQVLKDGEMLPGSPQMILLHAREGRWILWFWVLVPVLLGFVLWKPRLIGSWLLLLGFCALTTSWFSWQQRYSGHEAHLDPDRYGAYAQQIATWVTQPAERADATVWMRNYQHTHVALVPAVLSIPLMLGLDLSTAWVLLSALISFATLLVLDRLLRVQLKLPLAVCLFGILAFATHLIFLRSFGRPTTDQAGLLLVSLMLSLLVDRMQQRTARQTLGIALLVPLLILVRPPGLVYAAFLIGMTPFCDWLREKKFHLRDHLLIGLKVALPGVLAIGGLYLLFDWSHNFELAMSKREKFLDQWTVEWFRIMTLSGLQALVITWIFLKFRADWRPITVLGLWLVLHTLLLVASQAPFITRMMLPVLPCIITLTALSFGRFRSPWLRGIGLLWLGAHAIANVLITLWLLSLPYAPKNPWDHWFHA